jgi:hypothetical protein
VNGRYAGTRIQQFFARDLKLRHLRLRVAIDDAGRLSRAQTAEIRALLAWLREASAHQR